MYCNGGERLGTRLDRVILSGCDQVLWRKMEQEVSESYVTSPV